MAPAPVAPLLLLTTLAALGLLLHTASAQGPDTYANCTLVGSCTKPTALKYQCKLVNLGTTPLINPLLQPLFNYQPTGFPDTCLTPVPYGANPMLLTSLPSFGSSKTFSFCQNLTTFAANPSFLLPANQYLTNTIHIFIESGFPSNLNLTCKVSGYFANSIGGQPVFQVQCTLFNFNQGLTARNIVLDAEFNPTGTLQYVSAVGGPGMNLDMTINGPIPGNAKTGSPYKFTFYIPIPDLFTSRSGYIDTYLDSAFLTPS